MTGTLVLSLDFELAWGSFDRGGLARRLGWARWTHDVGVPLLIEHLERFEIPATWATVGAVMGDGLPPEAAELPEVAYDHFPHPWFAFAPREGGEDRHPEWFAPRLVERIRGMAPSQEIGSHSFSHVVFDHPGTPAARIGGELDLCLAAARRHDVELRSFVFPRNRVAGLDELRRRGFVAFRGPDPVRPFAGSVRAGAVLSDVAGAAPPPAQPTREAGMVRIPGSLMVRYAHAWRGAIPDRSRAARLAKGLDRAVAGGGVFHVWLHPINLAPRHPRLAGVLAAFLARAAGYRDDGRLRILTMGELAAEHAA